MPQLTLDQALQLARQHHQAGDLAQAEHLYRQILQQVPNHPDTLHLLGLVAYQVGQWESAADLIGQAVALNPKNPEAFNNLAVVLKDLGRLDAAIAAGRQAIALDPNYPEAYSNLGNALHARGDHAAAIDACRQAIALMPNHPQAFNNLANALYSLGQLDEAIAAYRQAIALNPRYPEACSNLSLPLKDQGQFDAAIAACRQAIALKPDFPEALNNLGNALRDQGQLDAAIAAYRQALALNPHSPEACNNLATALQHQGQLDAAIAACRQALALKPDFPLACGNLANMLHAAGQIDEALAAYRQALARAPDNAAIHSSLLFTLHYHAASTAPSLAAEHDRWNLRHAAPLQHRLQPPANDRTPERRLRIGYVSPDFREHPVGRFLLPLLAHHDPAQVEVYAYAQVPVPDALTRQLRAHTHAWRNIVGLTDSQTADLIRQDAIDILVDLAMHTANHRLLVFARRPAPVQVTYLAYASSTGLPAIDYRLSDPYLDPPGIDESVYTERTLRLPETYWCYQPRSAPADVGPLPALAAGHITLGSLNNFCKVTPSTLTAWADILRALPSAQLLLHAPEGSPRQRVHQHFHAQGIDPQRIRFAGHVPAESYFALYRQIDIALDTAPYGGGTTTCDALWMGAPVVTLVGPTAVGRAGLSILSNVGLPELAARTPQQYVQIATSLAQDLPRLTQWRSTLRQRMAQSPLMNAPRFAHHLQAAYRQMWRHWCA